MGLDRRLKLIVAVHEQYRRTRPGKLFASGSLDINRVVGARFRRKKNPFWFHRE
jgi:hypothetical protein